MRITARGAARSPRGGGGHQLDRGTGERRAREAVADEPTDDGLPVGCCDGQQQCRRSRTARGRMNPINSSAGRAARCRVATGHGMVVRDRTPNIPVRGGVCGRQVSSRMPSSTRESWSIRRRAWAHRGGCPGVCRTATARRRIGVDLDAADVEAIQHLVDRPDLDAHGVDEDGWRAAAAAGDRFRRSIGAIARALQVTTAPWAGSGTLRRSMSAASTK